MDKLKTYRNIILTNLSNQIGQQNSDLPNISQKLIVSKDENTFILMVMGWNKKDYMHSLIYHIELKNGKVWIHEDLTDSSISSELEEAGIPVEDIILGYLQPKETTLSQAKVA